MLKVASTKAEIRQDHADDDDQADDVNNGVHEGSSLTLRRQAPMATVRAFMMLGLVGRRCRQRHQASVGQVP